MYFNLTDFITKQALQIPEHIAVCDQKEQFTYYSFNYRVNQTVTWLQSREVQYGDRVAFLCENHVQALVLFIAIIRLGAIAIPLRTFLKSDEIDYMLSDSGAKILLYDPHFTNQVKPLYFHYDSNVLVPLDAHFQSSVSDLHAFEPSDLTTKITDPLMISYTSGTTGKPKGAIITHQNLWAALTYQNLFSTFSDSPQQQIRLLTLKPLSHMTGVLLCLSSLYTGSMNIIRSKLSPSEVWELVDKESIHFFIAVPSELRILLQDPTLPSRNLTSLRTITTGGAPIPSDLFTLCQEKGILLTHGYASTETGQLSIWHPKMGLDKRQTDGLIFSHVRVKIIDPVTKQTLSTGEIGEIIIKSPTVFAGYWNSPSLTESSFLQGWYRTGDFGKLDSEGFVTIMGRLKDMIIRDGVNIYPAEVESVVQELDEVQDVAVVGCTDLIEGEIPWIIVVKKENSKLTEEQILNYARSKLADHKCGNHVRFVNTLPYNEIGKVMKHKLKQQLGLN
ncbi:class I adenylate-forming enzyme family protein [Thermoflavimicrobium daqui]|uniref:Long-chain fatty acid--CoA ligase n=1 Tax=Thermoflavimicrobium daqui TaxID=2137476 RepID=A0A364K448_9BACL|nr:class I adenylate-forming enzyme family protein [Thermoflavimicrobium daqui]RAL24126.1 hypothetical protein DL897_10575 [Thermoflavimicrobium daqui]